MTTIKWTVTNVHGTAVVPEMNILFSEPESLLKVLARENTGAQWLTCPAIVDYTKNIFVVTAPFDFEVEIDRKTTMMRTSVPQNIYDNYFANRGNELLSINDRYRITMPPYYVFFSEETVMMEYLPAFLHRGAHLNNVRTFAGMYDISKWVRAVEFTCELENDTIPLKFKKGDPLFYVRFLPKNNSKVSLEQVEMDDKISNAIRACTGVKNFVKQQKLNTLYEMAAPYLALLGFKKKKCPIHFWKK